MSGKIVCESCTESKVSNNSQYFKEKEFNFKDHKSLSAASNNMLEMFIPLFYSKILLEQLSSYLNMKRLQNISILRRMSIPHKADKKKILTYFCDHYCDQCNLYISVLNEQIVIKSV